MHLMAQGVLESHFICTIIHVRFSLTSPSSLSTSTCPSPSSPFSSLSCTSSSTELDNLIAIQNLRISANKGSNDSYDVHSSLTGYEPNDMAFSELNDSSGSFSYITPSSDQDIDDTTLGKLLTEAHREYADYCDPEGVSVSQSSSVVFDRAGKLVGERNVDQLVLVSRETRTVLIASFRKNTQAEKVVDRSGKPEDYKET